MKMIRIVALLSVVLGLTACSHSKVDALARVQQTDLVRGLSDQYTNPIMFVERRDEAGVHVYLGFDEGTHTTRRSTLLVQNNGTVWEQVTKPDYQLDWEPVK
jgi:hypothetical protein